MANAGALINESLWRDQDFRKVPRLPQCTYQQLLAQKDLDCAGVLTLNMRLLAKGCADLTVEQLRDDFEVLESARFAFVDYDTDELLIRSYMRLVSVRSPNAWKSAMKAARLVESPKLRTVLAGELRRIPRKDAVDLANELDPPTSPSETHSEPIPNPSEGDNPSETHSEPPRSVLGRYLLSSGGQVGEEPPPCRTHPNGTGRPCRACGARREWQQRREADDELDARRRAREIADNCPDCHGTNLVDVGPNRVRKCDHPNSAVTHA